MLKKVKRIKLGKQIYRRLMKRRFARKADKAAYGQRWQSETVNSMIKRNLGSALRRDDGGNRHGHVAADADCGDGRTRWNAWREEWTADVGGGERAGHVAEGARIEVQRGLALRGGEGEAACLAGVGDCQNGLR